MIRDYYRGPFREDLRTFLGDSPVPYFGHAWQRTCAAQLSRVPSHRREEFVLCLYFTVLVDQAMYAHYRTDYPEFAALTQYPKFCHGLGQFQHNPRGVLVTPVEEGVISKSRVVELLPDAMTLFVEEVVSFFQGHMPHLRPEDFFEKVVWDPDVQIPELVALVDPTIRNDVVYVAYHELRHAVERQASGRGRPTSG